MTKEMVTTTNGILNKFLPQKDDSYLNMAALAKSLRLKGVEDTYMREALLVLMCLNAPSMGDPMAITLRCDEYLAGSILKACQDLTQDSSYLEVGNLSRKEFKNFDQLARGKCLIARDVKDLSSIGSALNRLLVDGSIPMNSPTREGGAMVMQDQTIMGPTGFLAVDNGAIRHTMNFPGLLLEIPQSTPSVTWLMKNRVTRSYSVEEKMEIKKSCLVLKRSYPLLVTVPLEAQLYQVFGQGVVDAYQKALMVLSVLSNATRINNVCVGREAFLNEFLDMDFKEQRESFTATKVDYYYTWLLLEGLIPSNDTVLTVDQKRVFEIIKAFNLGYYRSSTFELDLDVIIQTMIHTKDLRGYITREKLLQEVNKQGCTEMGTKKLIGIIKDLKEKEVIKEERADKNKCYYCIAEGNPGGPLELPHPSEMVDPVYQGQKIEVINPLTGQVEEI